MSIEIRKALLVREIEERIVELAGAIGPAKRHDLRRELARLKGAIKAGA